MRKRCTLLVVGLAVLWSAPAGAEVYTGTWDTMSSDLMTGTWVETFGPSGPGQPGSELAAEAMDGMQWMMGDIAILAPAVGVDNGDGTITYTTDYGNGLDPGASALMLGEAATLWGDALAFTNLMVTVEATVDIVTRDYIGGTFTGSADNAFGYRIMINGTLARTAMIPDPMGHEGTVDYLEVTLVCDATGPQLDIKPGSCPNPLNRKSRGKVPVALVGTADFDVSMVDVTTLLLSRADGMAGSVAPLEGRAGDYAKLVDVATPMCGDVCDCHEMEGDGIDDLLMRFSTTELVDALKLYDLEYRSAVELVVSGALMDGTPFAASDCVWILGEKKSRTRRGR